VDVKALVIDVDAAPELVDVEDTLDGWQGMVGGDIELVGLKDLVGEGIVKAIGSDGAPHRCPRQPGVLRAVQFRQPR